MGIKFYKTSIIFYYKVKRLHEKVTERGNYHELEIKRKNFCRTQYAKKSPPEGELFQVGRGFFLVPGILLRTDGLVGVHLVCGNRQNRFVKCPVDSFLTVRNHNGRRDKVIIKGYGFIQAHHIKETVSFHC